MTVLNHRRAIRAGVAALVLASPAAQTAQAASIPSTAGDGAGAEAAAQAPTARSAPAVDAAQAPHAQSPVHREPAAAEPASPQDQSAPALTPRPYPAAATGEGSTTGGYSLSRWAEDWRIMRDPASRDDPLDQLKFLPLDADGDIYLTLSGEARLRVNMTSNPGLREGPHQRQDLTRLVGGADLHLGPNLRVYGEVAHGSISGRQLGVPPATLRNALALQQYFFEAKGTIGNVAIGGRYGRQEFTDGPNQLVSQRDNNTIRYTLNGWRAWARGSRLRVDLFDLKPTAYGDLGPEDDVNDPARRFYGVTFGVVLPPEWLGGSRLFLDPFLWRRTNDVGAWGGRIGPAERNYAGARLWGDVGRLTIDWSANHQWGTYIDQEIDAWHVFTAQNYRLGRDPGAPRIGLRADYASGGGGYGQGKLRNAYAPFGNNVYYSYQLFLTPSNLVAVAPNLTFSPVDGVRVTTEYQFAWRANADDAVYRANGQPFAGTQLVGGTKIAESLRMQLLWTISPRLSFTARYEHLEAGPVLTRAGYTGSDFLAAWLSFRL